ncbi:Scr1 family TA system antitoxin-like transcriptional regulator [Streptomyces sp. NPDC005955]|uniref:helix-turn-helix domain-containing protein n=1 Tax=Streptomyces sp. NPDC005955 TaxID=3364738 RepID=UPI0036C12E3D
MARPPKELTPDKSVEDLLGWRIRRLRTELGWSVEQLAERVFVSPGRITQVETANDPPGKRLTEQLDGVLNAGGTLAELWPLIKTESFKDYARLFLRAQATARLIHEFSLAVPGLLQVDGYSRALMGIAYPENSADLEDAVARRMERQAVFDRLNPPWLWVILSESALTQAQGSPEVMIRQLDHLLDMTSRPNINIQILPSDRPSIPGSISLLTAPRGERSAYAEGFSSGTYYQEPDDVDRFQRIYDQLQAGALDIQASAQVIRDARRKHQ